MAKASEKARKSQRLDLRIEDDFIIIKELERIDARGFVIERIEEKDGHEHEQAARHREQYELDRRIDLARSSPDADQKIHRDEHRLPEDIEEEKVEGDKDTDDPGLQEEHEDKVLFDPILDGSPGGEKGDGHQKSRQDNQEEADPVDPEMIIDAVAEPGAFFHELGVGSLAVEIEIERQRDGEIDQRHGQSDRPEAVLLFFIDKDQEERTQQREERQKAQYWKTHVLKQQTAYKNDHSQEEDEGIVFDEAGL